ncbi:4-(cytidine 5'-diphospho)-2-C-methyl-D-erythritol kinase [Primorskyibacter sp. S87]|uniref:4-(cytidine 5'-diphospho)-2-C-methyl-D-erythritol kinase n=1 Tax=Primorskyibacter sp. S87 TaxID=3415126 RepID=UPI003C7D048F
MAIEVFAPAKINLTLHVTGQRDDGFHLLDSLVVFADVGDRITLDCVRPPTADIRVSIDGPRAQGVPTDRSNLVVRAAEAMGVAANIHVEKHLPAAAGIGGGSSDAAATLTGLARLTGRPLPSDDEVLGLGADIPLCLREGPQRMQGIGEVLTPAQPVPDLYLILANPGVSVPTPQVFRALSSKTNPPQNWPMPAGKEAWLSWLAAQRNDLQAPACSAAPVIGEVMEALQAQPGCRLSRMSGSGATCFAIMDDAGTQARAVRALRRLHPDWWVMPCKALP